MAQYSVEAITHKKIGIHLGSNLVKDLYIGNKKVSAVYLGNKRIDKEEEHKITVYNFSTDSAGDWEDVTKIETTGNFTYVYIRNFNGNLYLMANYKVDNVVKSWAEVRFNGTKLISMDNSTKYYNLPPSTSWVKGSTVTTNENSYTSYSGLGVVASTSAGVSLTRYINIVHYPYTVPVTVTPAIYINVTISGGIIELFKNGSSIGRINPSFTVGVDTYPFDINNFTQVMSIGHLTNGLNNLGTSGSFSSIRLTGVTVMHNNMIGGNCTDKVLAELRVYECSSDTDVPSSRSQFTIVGSCEGVGTWESIISHWKGITWSGYFTFSNPSLTTTTSSRQYWEIILEKTNETLGRIVPPQRI